MKNTQTITRKIKLIPLGEKEEVDRIYAYLRNGMEIQAKMLNQFFSAFYIAKMNKAPNEEIKDIISGYSRIPNSPKGSLYQLNEEDIKKFPIGLPLASCVTMYGKKKFDKACKDGLLYGKVSLPSFRKDGTLMVPGRFLDVRGRRNNEHSKRNAGLYHTYESDFDFYEALYKERNPELYLSFVNNMSFRLELGAFKSSMELRKTIERIYDSTYKVCDSQIKIKDNKILLLLSLEIPVEQKKLKEDVVVGVDMGLAIPAVCALNNNKYTRLYIGSAEEFAHYRTKIQAQRRSLQTNIKFSKGGHGRTKKLRAMERFSDYEHNYVHNYNHNVSKRVVDFALKHNAKYINIENLSDIGKEEKKSYVLRNWSYFELQSMITYKAAKYGIIVRKVAPEYTSQICSICGHRGERYEQDKFRCTNPKCKCHTKIYTVTENDVEKPGTFINADFNGARNIAMSTNFTEDIKSTKSIEMTKDFVKDNSVLLKKGETYSHNLFFKNGIVKIMCEDGYFHELDAVHDLEGMITSKDFTYILEKIYDSKK